MREIREARLSDGFLLAKMYLTEVEADQKKAQVFADDLLELNTIVCIDDKRVVGTVSWARRGGVEDGVIELVTIGVSPSHKRQGIGTELVKKMMASARESYAAAGHGLRFVYLFMESRNEPARRFYENLGFEESCTVPLMYPNDNAAMWTLLT